MRVNQTDTVSQGNMLDQKIPKQGRLAGASFANEVNVISVIWKGNAKRTALLPAVPFANDDFSRFQDQPPLVGTKLEVLANAVGSEPMK